MHPTAEVSEEGLLLS